MPKEPKFFPVLKNLSDVTVTASELMIECLENYEHKEAVRLYKKIKDQEREGDRLSTKIFDQLNSTFITPFDREDIQHLANSLDDVADGINSVAKRIALYNPKTIPESAVRLAKLLHEATLTIGKAIDQLDVLKKNPTKVKQYSQELHDIENRGDDVYEEFIIDLFDNATDAMEAIKLKEIIHELEQTVDIAERVGKIIRTIIIKYA